MQTSYSKHRLVPRRNLHVGDHLKRRKKKKKSSALSRTAGIKYAPLLEQLNEVLKSQGAICPYLNTSLKTKFRILLEIYIVS